MRLTATRYAIALTLLLAAAASDAGDDFLIGFTGYDYESDGSGGADPTPDTLLAVGDAYEMLGFVTAFHGPLSELADMANNEYTYVLRGVRVTSRMPFGNVTRVQGAGGRLEIYEDPIDSGTLANYGGDPPDANALASFTDGTLVLTAAAELFGLTYDSATGLGSWEFEMNADGGLWADQLPASGPSCNSYVGAALAASQPNMPPGYHRLAVGEHHMNCVVPTRISTWGELKTRYR